MNFYCAGRYQNKEAVKAFSQLLIDAGHNITSNWVYEAYDPNTALSDLSIEENSFCALTDCQEIISCDEMVFFSENETTATARNGRHVEFGFALALNKKINVIGPKYENVFHYLPNVINFSSQEEFIEYVSRIN